MIKVLKGPLNRVSTGYRGIWNAGMMEAWKAGAWGKNGTLPHPCAIFTADSRDDPHRFAP